MTSAIRSSVARALLVATLVATAACAAQPIQKPLKGDAVDTGPGTLAAARRYLEGAWALESFDIYPPGKGALRLAGTGTLTYDGYGNLKMDIQPDPASADVVRASGIDLQGNRFVSDGRTVVDMQARTLAYVLEGRAPGTGPLALNRLRHWQVDGTLLTLTTRDDAGKPASVSKWRKQ